MALSNVIARLKVALSVDTSDLDSGLAATQAKLRATSDSINSSTGSMKGLEKATDDLTGSTKDAGNGFDRLKSSMDRTKTSMDAAKGSTSALSKAHSDLKAAISGVFSSNNDLSGSLDRIKTIMSGGTTQAKAYKDALRDAGLSASDADASFKKLVTTMSSSALRGALAGPGTGSGGAGLAGVANSLIGSLGTSGASSGSEAGSSLFGLSTPVIVGVGGAIGGLTAIMAPFLAVFGEATVILAGFTVGLAGLLSTATLFLGGLGLLVGGMAALAISTGKVNGPLNAFEKTWKGVGDALGQAAAPAVGSLLKAADALAPAVQAIAMAWIKWYDSISPQVLAVFTNLAQMFLSVIQALTPQIEAMTGVFLQMMPSIMPIFQQLANVGAQTITGLLTNLISLSNWFITSWPQIGPIVGDILSWIGSKADGLMKSFGRVVGWMVQNWPTLTKAASDWANIIGAGFNLVMSVMPSMSTAFQGMGDLLSYIRDHASSLRPIIIALGLVIGGLIAVFALAAIAIGGAIILIVAGIVWFVGQIQSAVALAKADWSDMWQSGIVQVARQNITTVLSAFDSMRTALASVWSGVVSDAKSIFNGIGSAVNSGIGGAESVIGSFISDINQIGIPGLSITNPFSSGGGKPGGGGGGGESGLQLASGGIVPGGYGGGDRVPAMLTPGEGVISLAGMRGLGAGAFHAINAGLGAGLGAGSAALGNLSSLINTVGGQCLAWVSKMTGLFYGVPFAADLAPDINSRTPSAGEIFVATWPPFGHTGFVTGPAVGGNVPVIDSNFNLDGRILSHTIPASMIAGYINENLSLGGLTGAAAAALNPIGTIQGLMSGALGKANALTGWPGPQMASGLINMIGTDVKNSLGSDVSSIAAQAAKAATGKGGSPTYRGLGGGHSSPPPGPGAGGGTTELHWHAHGGNTSATDFIREVSWAHWANVL